jgi:hypothetical protein
VSKPSRKKRYLHPVLPAPATIDGDKLWMTNCGTLQSKFAGLAQSLNSTCLRLSTSPAVSSSRRRPVSCSLDHGVKRLIRALGRRFPGFMAALVSRPRACNTVCVWLREPTILRGGSGGSLTRVGVMKVPSASARLGSRNTSHQPAAVPLHAFHGGLRRDSQPQRGAGRVAQNSARATRPPQELPRYNDCLR